VEGSSSGNRPEMTSRVESLNEESHARMGDNNFHASSSDAAVANEGSGRDQGGMRLPIRSKNEGGVEPGSLSGGLSPRPLFRNMMMRTVE
jgi:hypothetical protein